jgi:hypothetical protein
VAGCVFGLHGRCLVRFEFFEVEFLDEVGWVANLLVMKRCVRLCAGCV